MDLVEKRLEISDTWGLAIETRVMGDLAPFVWAFKHCGFCIMTLYDKDIGQLRDDLLFVAKRQGIELRWRRTAAEAERKAKEAPVEHASGLGYAY
jgi:hypothetical protein